jgi:UDP-N-acetyl-D-galactosamine dehydrogenase
MISNKRIAVIGLGYVVPLARLFATKYPVVGFDINQSRINGLLSGTDSTGNFGSASSTFR